VRDVLLNEIKQQQQRAVEYENTAASVAAQQVQKTSLVLPFSITSPLALTSLFSTALHRLRASSAALKQTRQLCGSRKPQCRSSGLRLTQRESRTLPP
jgi:hypothetical protein